MHYYLRNPYLLRVLCAGLLDSLCLGVAALFAWSFARPEMSGAHYAAVAMLGGATTCGALIWCEAYDPLRLGSRVQTQRSVISAMALAFVAALLIYFAVPTPEGVVRAAAVAATVYFPLFLAGRAGYRFLARRAPFTTRVAIVGASELGAAIAGVLRERAGTGLECCGFLTDDDVDLPPSSFAGSPVLGRVDEVEKLLDQHRVDLLVVAARDRERALPSGQLLGAKLSGVRVESGVAFYERVAGRIYLRGLRPSYLIFGQGFRENRGAALVRRGLDVVAGTVGLFLTGPFLALCALAIKLDSAGPVFFRQARVGKDGREYRILKLRTMRHEPQGPNSPLWTQAGDDRITRVGRVLRQARLDEFPQLWNVLRGEMTLVGPRPEMPEFVERLCEEYPYFRLRSTLKPGITGWAQVRFGYVNNIAEVEEKVALDLYYMKHRSLLFDLAILLQTVKTVVLFRGL